LQGLGEGQRYDRWQMTAKQVWRLVVEEKDLRVSYCTAKRYLRSRFQFGAPAVTVRLEVEPGSQAQVDFGSVGLIVDAETARRRRAWAFVMTLSFSRHRFVRFVFRQDVATWIDCHARAVAFLGGVPSSQLELRCGKASYRRQPLKISGSPIRVGRKQGRATPRGRQLLAAGMRTSNRLVAAPFFDRSQHFVIPWSHLSGSR
jgi:hypothetical protein